MLPADEAECRAALSTAFGRDHPTAVRYPRGSCTGQATPPGLNTLPWGRGELRRESTLAPAGAKGRTQRIALLAFGTVLYPALAAGERLNATVANMRFVKPIDEALILELADRHALLVTVEENAVMGGAGSAVAETLQAHRRVVPLLQLGLPDRFIDQGDPGIQLAECGLNKDGIVKAIRARLGE